LRAYRNDEIAKILAEAGVKNYKIHNFFHENLLLSQNKTLGSGIPVLTRCQEVYFFGRVSGVKIYGTFTSSLCFV